MKLNFSVEDCWWNSFFSPPGTAGGQKGTYFYLYDARQLKLHSCFMDVVTDTCPLIDFLNLQNKYRHLTTENFQIHSFSCDSCFF